MVNYLRLLRIHIYTQLLEHFRQPMYVVSTLIFPAMFFWFFGVPNAKTSDAALLLVGSFSCFAVLGVVLFQFSIGIAQEKNTPWSNYLSVLPLPDSLRLIPRILNSFFIAGLSVLAVTAVALISTPLNYSDISGWSFMAALALGAIPFALFGAGLGYAANSKSIVPLANLVYLPLSFAGGLWMPPQALPASIQEISKYLPTRFFGEFVWASLLKTPLNSENIWGLTAYTAVFLIFAIFYFKKYQAQEFR
ncbi:ABC transporter permease [Bdellovibrio sp. SKB1291214]|uniref:ABC transporter permease n=1 Tax=Bdellovibrio sp. SKB1291214 TaxID=1732569 RepID=UPI000B51B362|nr:ABC transporter permease [Bdellovibrio sp. SKB1291214]UYL07852.1 ABC transporter permease [Bdellovibrio sp. SKB1291214]